jgi:hypothetical protein
MLASVEAQVNVPAPGSEPTHKCSGCRPGSRNDPDPADREEGLVTEADRLEAAIGECREMLREAHAATKDLRAAVREAKRELQALAKDEVAAQVQHEVSRQLEELGERTHQAISLTVS